MRLCHRVTLSVFSLYLLSVGENVITQLPDVTLPSSTVAGWHLWHHKPRQTLFHKLPLFTTFSNQQNATNLHKLWKTPYTLRNHCLTAPCQILTSYMSGCFRDTRQILFYQASENTTSGKSIRIFCLPLPHPTL